MLGVVYHVYFVCSPPPYTFYTLLEVVGHYHLSVLCTSETGFKKPKEKWIGGVGPLSICLGDFRKSVNFAKPLSMVNAVLRGSDRYFFGTLAGTFPPQAFQKCTNSSYCRMPSWLAS